METRTTEFTEARPLLFSIAYRMLGSVADAEDIVQDAYLRWLEAPEAEIRAPRAYLATIVTRLSINRLRSARSQRETYVGPWLPEPLVTEHAPDPSEPVELAESLSMAFLVMLELLAEDITLWADGGGKIRGAALRPIHGTDSVARFLIGVTQRFVPAERTLRPTHINGQPGFIAYVSGRPFAALIFDIREHRVHPIYAIGNPDKLEGLATKRADTIDKEYK